MGWLCAILGLLGMAHMARTRSQMPKDMLDNTTIPNMSQHPKLKYSTKLRKSIQQCIHFIQFSQMHLFRGWILLPWCCHFCCWADFSSHKKSLTFRVQLAWHPHFMPLKGKKNTSIQNVADELRWIKDPLSKQNSGVKRHHSSFMLRVSFETIKWQARNPRGLLCLHHFLKKMGPSMTSSPIPWIFPMGFVKESAPSRVARAFGRVSDASSTATVSERGMAHFWLECWLSGLPPSIPNSSNLSIQRCLAADVVSGGANSWMFMKIARSEL